jgi:capsular polysaccharide biosynthesis protein
VNDPDLTFRWSDGDKLPGRLWADEAGVDEERSVADATGGLVSLKFFTAALRRSAGVWCLTAVLGLLIGSALYVKFPPAYHATATVLLADAPGQNPQNQVQTDLALAESQAVAVTVVQKLKLPQSVLSFQAAYTVMPVTNNVLTFNVGAPSSADAVQRVSALTAAFLAYRAHYTQSQQAAQFTQLDQQYSAAQKRLKSIEAQVRQLPSANLTPTQQAQYDNLQTQESQQNQIIQYVTATKSTTEVNTEAIVNGTYVLDAATALPRSKIKGPALYVVGGLFGGLALGMGGVLIAALLSTGLRRRDDVAAAMGAPVRLSVGPLRARRWWLTLPRRAAKQRRDLGLVVAYLRRAVPGSSRGPASLAVVAMDDAQVVAQAVTSLALSYANENKQVVAADLSGNADLARLLGISDSGIHPISQHGADFLVVLPERADVAPAGPVPFGASPAVPETTDEALVTACSSADLLLILATLDPAFGGDYLGTWATNAVAVVTAGQSSAEKIHGVAEMIRLAGTRLDSGVLIGADKSDESLGIADAD